MNDESKSTLTEVFEKYFKVELAVSAAQKEQVFRIRHRVYCEEFKYQAVDPSGHGLETDEFDPDSRHCLITHIHDGIHTPAGCVRLVPALETVEKGLLPLEKFCRSSLDQPQIDSMKLERSSICEISRLAVDSAYRRRDGESLTRYGQINGTNISEEERRSFSLIAIACFLAATVMTDMDQRTNVFAMMEPFLPRLMHRSGIDFQRVGKDMDYHGIRAPYFITTQSALENMHPDLLKLYHWIKSNIGK
jgi:N-acyl amino acid synthase of PEP-CTERM/exosortase system